MKTTYDDYTRVARLSGGQTLRNIHSSRDCLVEFCPIHFPSDHAYSDKPLFWDEDGGFFYRKAGTVYVADPDDYLLNRGHKLIFRNSGYCPECTDHIESVSRWDFVKCKCGKVFTDGGHHYLRRSPDLVDTSIIFTKEDND